MRLVIMTRTEQIQKAAMEHASYKQQGAGDAYLDFVRTAEWADRTLIEKACEWLKFTLEGDFGYYGAVDFTNTFRKAMEE